MTITDPAELAPLRRAFAARDRAWDGRFVVAVSTTRIYCRPSCPARRPRPEHTAFYRTGAEAAAAGYRACRRCVPDAVTRDRAAVERVVGRLRTASGPVPLAALAGDTGYSPSHLQRLFTRIIGVSPAAYARALREERARQALAEGESVTGAVYAAGFENPSGFYQTMKGKLGMAPSAWVKGGAGVTIRWALVQTSLGPMLVAASEQGVCRLSFGGGPEELGQLFPRATLVEGGAEFGALLQRVVAAVDQPARAADIPLDVRGTVFQERVWQALRAIPPGETRTYAEIAAAAGNPRAVRAAGSANGANPVAVLIPCHRVVRSDGTLGGYAYGETVKRELLRREGGAHTKL